jgi:hypothetical protein
MKEPVASGANLLVMRDQLIGMRAELFKGLARGGPDARQLPVLAQIQAAIDALAQSPRRMVIIAPPGEPIRLAFYSEKYGIEATQIAIKCDKTGRIVATIDHWTDEPEGDEAVREPPDIEVGSNQGGNPTASRIAEPVGRLPQKRHRRSKLSPAQARALELLTAMIEKAGEIPPANGDIPANAACIEETLWRGCCYQDAISGSDKPNTRQRAFKRAAKALLAKGFIGTWGGLVWTTGVMTDTRTGTGQSRTCPAGKIGQIEPDGHGHLP